MLQIRMPIGPVSPTAEQHRRGIAVTYVDRQAHNGYTFNTLAAALVTSVLFMHAESGKDHNEVSTWDVWESIRPNTRLLLAPSERATPMPRPRSNEDPKF